MGFVVTIGCTDGNGVPRAINIPEWGDSTPAESADFPNRVYADMADIVTTTGEAMYAELTYICANALIKEFLLTKGFVNVYTASELGNKLILPNNNYLQLDSSGTGVYDAVNTIYKDSNGNRLESTANKAMTICSYSQTQYRGYDTSYCAFGVDVEFNGVEYNVYTGISRIVKVFNSSELSLGELWWNGVQPTPQDTDPFSPGGENEPGGGGGDFSDPSEDVTDPAVPDISAVDTGFITLFNPSVSQLNSLASYMWSAGFDLDTFKKMFANPMDCILGLSILPKIVPAGGSRTVMVGNISTGVSMTVAASQYVKFDCGSVTVKRYSNSFLDYAPYTKVSIYLPFIGIHEMAVDDVMNKSVHVKYNIDILSGACAAFVICGGTTLYTYNGQCAASVPVTSGDWSNMINGVIGAVGGALKAAVGGAAMGGLVGAVGAGAASLASSAMDVAGMKPSVEHSGNMGGMGGMMGVKTPFLIITRPQQAIPGQQNKYTGYPAFVTKELNDLEGYTEIEEIHLENIPGTEQEITEIYNLLRSGVIL